VRLEMLAGRNETSLTAEDVGHDLTLVICRVQRYYQPQWGQKLSKGIFILNIIGFTSHEPVVSISRDQSL